MLNNLQLSFVIFHLQLSLLVIVLFKIRWIYKIKRKYFDLCFSFGSFAVLVFWISGFYKTIFRYSGKSALSSISLAIGIYGLLTIILITIYGISGVPRSIGIIHPLVLFLVYVSRLFVRYFLDGNFFLKIIKAHNQELLFTEPEQLVDN